MDKNDFLRAAASIFRKTIIVLSGLIFALVLLEAGLRLGGFVLLSIQEYENLRSANQKGVYRILCLGESTTYKQYPPFLEMILNQSDIGVQFSVVDKARPGTDTSAIVDRIDSYLDEIHPDMVIAMMGINDYNPSSPSQTMVPPTGTSFFYRLQTYKLARLIATIVRTKCEVMGLCKTPGIKQSPGQTPQDPNRSISAEESLKQAVQMDPKNIQARIELGRLYHVQGDKAQAQKILEQAAAIDPQSDIVQIGFGWFYRSCYDFARAEASFKKAIALNPKNDCAYDALGSLYRLQKNFPGAKASLEAAVAVNPNNDSAYVELGKLYRDLAKWPEAEVSFERALVINPENENACLALGGVYRMLGKSSQALAILKTASEHLPQKNGRILESLASLYREMGRYDLAKASAEKAEALGTAYYSIASTGNFRKLKGILDQKGVKLVCVQYPMRSVEPLKRIFENDAGVIFVDNERSFRDAVKRASYGDYFSDIFGGNFGHCTPKGNKLLAQNIADVILREVFNKR